MRSLWVAMPVALLVSSYAVATTSCSTSSYTQEQQDSDTLWAFRKLLTDLWNANIAGTPTGAQDITATSTGGGSVHISGETASDGSRDLTYAFTSYQALAAGTAVTLSIDDLSGEISQNGSPDEAVLYGGEDLDLSATLTREGYAAVPMEGQLTFDGKWYSDGGSGSIDGRPKVTYGSHGTPDNGNCSLYPINCGQVNGGVKVVGGVVPVSCACPQGTTKAGEDLVTPGGPYNICTCNGY